MYGDTVVGRESSTMDKVVDKVDVWCHGRREGILDDGQN